MLMAAFSSSATTTQVKKYDVFLSFRGEDTRNNFTGHFYSALCRNKIETFIDNQLKIGDEISSSLLNTIEASKISVIIFSEKYASSSWCLQELEHIIKCMKKNKQNVMPIFYHVEPSHVRYQTESFGKGFAKLKEDFKEEIEKLQRWKTALREAANLSGLTVDAKTPENVLIEKAVEDIVGKLNKMSPSYNKDLVGVESAMRKIEKLLRIGLDGVSIVGIWGMGGIGKTTISRAIFNNNSRNFDGHYFFENVRAEELKDNRLTNLQKEFLSTTLNDKHTNTSVEFTPERLGRGKFLIVFDDITSKDQIEKLIRDPNYLGSGSRIIITTREKHLLRNCGVDDSNTYKVEGLCYDYALQLFSQHAFKQKGPIEGYIELSNQVVQYTKGVPLALKVLGLFLHGRKKMDWESEIKKIGKFPPPDIHDVLRISYDGLDCDQKNIFLDIVCFFIGWKKCKVQDILDASDFYPGIGISVLEDKALITTSNGIIAMHDLLQEMGRQIVREESINDLGKQSRLWDYKDICSVLKKKMGTGAVQGISLDISKVSDASLDCHALASMCNLRFLHVYNSSFYYGAYNYANKFDGFEDLKSFSIDIRYFGWDGYPFKSLPSKVWAENLVRLDMPDSKVKHLWHGAQNLVKLKYINLSYSKEITEIPDLSRALELEVLKLRGCSGLLEITSASSIQNLKKLVKLDLSYCTRLFSVPDGIQSKTIVLRGCSNLQIAPKISRKVEKLYLSLTAIKESPFIEYPSNLLRFDLSNCSKLKSLSSSICKLKLLKYLCLSFCKELERLPNDFGDLEALEDLVTFGAIIREVPLSILHLNKIKSLNLSQFDYDEAVPMNWIMDSSSGSSSLENLYLDRCRITRLPDNLGKLSFLRRLGLRGNDFKSIAVNIKDLSNLIYLDISDCKMLQSLPELPRGLNVAAKNCSSLELISNSSFLFLDRLRGQMVDFSNCFKLDLWKFFPKESYQGYCASICFPGNKVPEWFNFKNAGSYIALEQSPHGQNESIFLGFYVCVVFSPGNERFAKDIVYQCLIINKDDKIEDYVGKIPINSPCRGEDHLFLGGHNGKRRLYKMWGPLDEEYELCLKKMGNSKVFIEFKNDLPLNCARVKECGIHFFYDKDCGKYEEEAKDEPQSVKLQISNAFEDESSSRPQFLSKFPCDLKSVGAESWKLERNALRDIVKDALLNVQQNTIVWSEVEEITCENPKGCMCFPGHEIPSWFDIQNVGNYIVLPRGSLDHNFVGLVFCIVVAFQFYVDDIKDFLVNCKLYFNDLGNNVAIGAIKGSFEGDKRDSRFINSYDVFLGYDCVMCTQEFRELSYNSEVLIHFSVTNYDPCDISDGEVEKCDSSDTDYDEWLSECEVEKSELFEGKVKKCGVRLLYTQDFEKLMEESKILKNSNYSEEESSSRCGLHPINEKGVEEFNPITNPSNNPTLLDVNEFPQDFAGPTTEIATTKRNLADWDGAELRIGYCNEEPQSSCAPMTYDMQSNNFTLLDLNEFPQDFVGSPMDVSTNKRSLADCYGAELDRNGCDEDDPQPKRVKEFKFL